MGESKIPLARIDAGTCEVRIGRVIEDGKIIDPGRAIQVHSGEWIEVVPVFTVQEYLAQRALQLSVNDNGEGVKALCRGLARRIVKWNWTDLMGETLEQPYGRPDILEGLTIDELLWLARQPEETGEARKKGSAPLANS